MAEGKKSFILYSDYLNIIEKLPDDKAGQLFKIILEYVNDRNPKIENDLLLEISFEPIKLQLKRDLKNWEDFRAKQSSNGKQGGRPRKPKPLIEKPKNPSLNLETQKSLTVTVTDTVNVNDTVMKKESGNKLPPLEERIENFRKKLIPFVDEFGKEMIRAFFDYWTEKNEEGKKTRFEMEKVFDLKKRLKTWKSRENTFKKPSEQTPKAIKPKQNYDHINS